MPDSVERLFNAVVLARSADPARSRTARLMRSGRPKMAKKLAEEAVEVVVAAMSSRREAVVRESADLLYNLVVLWVEMGLSPGDVWQEMDERERLLGVAEKMPKDLSIKDLTIKHLRPDTGRRKVVALAATARPLRKR